MGDEVGQVGGARWWRALKLECLENYALFDGEPVERVENGSDRTGCG